MQSGPEASCWRTASSTGANEVAVTTRSVRSQACSAISDESASLAPDRVGSWRATTIAPEVTATAKSNAAAPQSADRVDLAELCLPMTLPVYRTAAPRPCGHVRARA
jgi:hypothetical protein